ncbi:glycosyltransferase [Mycolicibacterium lacusdiani]|uniref:glycosyltransferase n=1 Tax=Mycolicibacterium lacusdiani TaxID=2895283 RepID=UPI001F46AB48|nr:glycosyltransferase [Mycolicibacterium lacusdiani]
MKVSLVGPHAEVDADGRIREGTHAGRRVSGLASALSGQGHAVTVYTRRAHAGQPDQCTTTVGYVVKTLTAGEIAVAHPDDELPTMGEFAQRLDAAWTSDRPDVVHADWWTYGIAAQLAANHHDVPTVQTFTAIGSVQRRRQNRDAVSDNRTRMEKVLARNACWVTASCSEDLDELVRFGRPRGRMSVLGRGVDTEAFTVEGPVASRTERHRVVVVARNLLPHRNIDLLIRAMATVPDAELLVIGGPPRSDLRRHDEACRLHRIAVETAVADRVHFTGAVPPTDMPALMRSADVLVCPSAYEPFGLPVVEAMACGVPVVASSVGGMVDTVVHDVTGLLVSSVTPRTLGHAVRNVLRQGVLRRGMGLAGRARASSRYGWERVARDTEVVYDRLLTTADRRVRQPS